MRPTLIFAPVAAFRLGGSPKSTGSKAHGIGRTVRMSALTAVGVLSLVTACGTPPQTSAATQTEFTAFASDFRGYHSWTHFDTTGGAKAGGIHDGSTVTEYINHVPPHGSTSFPVGTIIVKEATPGTPVRVADAATADGGAVIGGQAHELFAMVKRGGTFNDSTATRPGAPGWAWYDLKNTNKSDDSVTITWGPNTGPPAGDVYGGNPNGGCNACHTACANDAVCAKPLSLSNF